MKDFMELGQRILQAQPFSRLLGTGLEHLAAGEAVLTLPVREDFLQQHGYVHGGVVSYLADNALTFAGGAEFGDAVTVEYKINYVRPAKAQRLRAEAKTAAAGKRLATCQCEIWAETEGDEPYICAVAQGTIMAK
ncbi:PaaI family thioesterase [Marinobacter sp.]|uniref:PaaI family thioesterase n=1 Tax=Marinobacter sp. TaxID=50741 RepID=UPI00384FC7D9